MNQITGASQSAGSTTQQGLPPAGLDRLDRLDNGFSPAIPGQTRAEWLEQARTSTNPDMRAFYNELVTLAGGRTDDAALIQVIDLFQRSNAAETPRDVGLVQRDMLDQITTMLSRFDPLNNLLNAVQPHLADVTRAAGLGETAWGASLQGVLDTPGSAAAFNDGLRAGIVAGGKEMIVGTATMIGGLVRHQADTSVLGHVGDWVRSHTGPLPGALDTMSPSAARGAKLDETMKIMGGKIGAYLGAVADDPVRLKTDIANTINAQWSRLEASHAAAAARGPQEEARWWGETVGRVSFEVVTAVVPVTKGGTIAKVADGAADVVQAVNRADGAAAAAVRAADGAGDAVGDAARVAAGGTDEAAAAGITASRVAGAVRPLEVSNYGDLAARSVRDGMTPDHIPSFAAVRNHIEAQIDGTLTPAQLRELRNNTTAIVYDTSLHQKFSRTYGGRNSAAQIAGDAFNLRVAAETDMARIRPHLIEQGMLPAEVDAAFASIHRANIELGLYE